MNKNDIVSIEYTVIDQNTKEVVDSNVDAKPLDFMVGREQIIPGLESKLVELSKNDKADILVAPEDGYGTYNDDAVQTLPKEQFEGVELAEGMTLYGSGENGETVQVIVKSFNDETVEIDYNHPLAGKTLMFTVTILDVRAATEEEITTGVVGGMASGGCCGGGSCGTHEEPVAKADDHQCCGGGHCS